jgi:hypothetical protein
MTPKLLRKIRIKREKNELAQKNAFLIGLSLSAYTKGKE